MEPGPSLFGGGAGLSLLGMPPPIAPQTRPDLADYTRQNVFTNALGQIDGDRLQAVLLYMQASFANLLTDGGFAGQPGTPANPNYAALLAALAGKTDKDPTTGLLQLSQAPPAAPDWKAGKQIAGALVHYQGIVYRVKQAIVNGQSNPAGNLAYYLPIGPGTSGSSKAGALSATTLNVDPNIGNKYKLSPDLKAAVKALLDAGEVPVWIIQDTGAAARTTVNLAQRGVVADGQLDASNKLAGARTDNTMALFAARDEFATGAFREQQELTQVFPAGGVVAYKNNRFPLGLNNVIYDLNGATLVADYDGSDNQLGRGAYTGEGPMLDVAGYQGTKSYMLSVRFNTALKGSTQLTVQNPADLTAENGWIVNATFLPFAHETVFRGFPVGSTRFEDGSTRITDLNRETGVVKFFPPLSQDYLASGPDFLGGSIGERSGAARAQPLDHPGHPMPDYVEFTNGTIVKARNTPEAFAISAKKVRASKLHIIGNFTPTESPAGFEGEDLVIDGEIELDKLVGPTTFKNVEAEGFISNGGGIKSFEWEGGRSGTSLQVSPPTARIVNVHCHAKPFSLYDVTTDTTIVKDSDPALADYAGGHVSEMEIGNLKLSAATDSMTTAYIGLGSYREVSVAQVDNGRIKAYHDGTDKSEALPYLKNMAVGTPIFTIAGDAGGRVSLVEFVPDTETLVTGYVYTSVEGLVPAVGMQLTFRPLRNLKDNGGHVVETPAHPARVYDFDALILKGNQLPATAKQRTVTITKSDLHYNEFGAAYFGFRAKPTSVSFSNPATSAGRVKLTMLDKGRTEAGARPLCCFSLGSTTTRSCSATTSAGGMVAIDAGEPDQNQYLPTSFGQFAYTCNVFLGNVAVSAAPEFSLTFTFDTY